MMNQLLFENITFGYETSLKPILKDVTASFPEGWTGIIGPNGTGKTTLLKLACGELTPIHGNIRHGGRACYCSQRTDDPPSQWEEFLQSGESEAWEWRGRLKIREDWFERWPTLSQGERKRAQLAVILWQDPDILAVDEPTNHLDREARRLVGDALAAYRGIGLLVSHDRELLDNLCRQCLMIDPPQTHSFPGGYTEASRLAKQKEAEILGAYQKAKSDMERLMHSASARLDKANRYRNGFSKRNLDIRDSDSRSKIDLARVSGKDGKAGRLADQLNGRVRQATEKVSQFNIKKKYETDFWVLGESASRDLLLQLPAGSIELGEGRILEFPALELRPTDRIALTGLNGTGKTTLLNYILNQYLTLPEGKWVYLPQEIHLEEASRIMERFHQLPEDEKGRVMTLVSCLGSRPDRLVGGRNLAPSPGEIRKLLLALGAARNPWLIIMDEPTNHLDLPSVEALESALSEFPGALILVSHDERFLSRLARVRWEIHSDNDSQLKLQTALIGDAY